MKIYTLIDSHGIRCTASEQLIIKAIQQQNDIKAIIEWKVKTQGKNFNKYAEGKYIIDNRHHKI